MCRYHICNILWYFDFFKIKICDFTYLNPAICDFLWLLCCRICVRISKDKLMKECRKEKIKILLCLLMFVYEFDRWYQTVFRFFNVPRQLYFTWCIKNDTQEMLGFRSEYEISRTPVVITFLILLVFIYQPTDLFLRLQHFQNTIWLI